MSVTLYALLTMQNDIDRGVEIEASHVERHGE